MPQRLAFPRVCIAIGFPDAGELLEHARLEAEAGERFLEFRLDFLSNPGDGLAAIRELTREYPEITVLATCRRHQNHGRFNGSIDEQIALLSEAVDAGARAVDVEVESAEVSPSRLHAFDGRAQIVLSYHNYDGTPAMETVVRRMVRIPASVYKVVSTARKPSDNQRLLALLKAFPRTPLVVLAMGETGFPSRVLSAMLGGVFTYATPSTAEGTASGQVAARLLRQLYRIDKLGKASKIFGVIADPVRHSISPAVHNRALHARRLDAVYLPFLVSPLQLRDFFQLASALPVAGFSVTIPHKQKIIRYLDAVDPLARRIGAVNTVWKKAGKWRGANTDAEGIRVPLEKRLRISKSSVLVVGNGGAARSAAFTLAAGGARLAITGRNLDRVRALAKACGAVPVTRQQAEAETYDAVVHATSLGMWPHGSDECFFSGRVPGSLVFDLVYTPQETELLRRAKAQRATIIPGLEMFLEQAAAQFHYWTGQPAPRSVMQTAALEALAAQQQLCSGKEGS